MRKKTGEHLLLIVSLGYYLFMAMLVPGFFTVANSWNLLFNLLPLLLLSLGQTLVMITAGIDLSVTSVVALCSVCGGIVMSGDTAFSGHPALVIALGVGVMLLVGGLIGCFNGLAVAYFQMPPFMVTLTGMIFFSGLAIWLTGSQNIYHLPESFVNMPYSRLVWIPIPLLVGLPLVVFAHLILNRSLYGRWIYSTGLNPKVAILSGVPVRQIILLVYTFCGLCAAAASTLYTSRLETGSPVMGQQILLDVIGAVVIGGTSLFGGKGKVLWTVYGVLFITLLDNSLNLIGLSYFLIMVVKGGAILTAAVLYTIRDRALKMH